MFSFSAVCIAALSVINLVFRRSGWADQYPGIVKCAPCEPTHNCREVPVLSRAWQCESLYILRYRNCLVVNIPVLPPGLSPARFRLTCDVLSYLACLLLAALAISDRLRYPHSRVSVGVRRQVTVKCKMSLTDGNGYYKANESIHI